jgi:hypothetical protein
MAQSIGAYPDPRLVLEQVEKFRVRCRAPFSESGSEQIRNPFFFSSNNNGRRLIDLKDCSARRAWLKIIAPSTPKNRPIAWQHAFSRSPKLLKCLHAITICSHQVSVPRQALFLYGRETSGFRMAFWHRLLQWGPDSRAGMEMKSCSRL